MFLDNRPQSREFQDHRSKVEVTKKSIVQILVCFLDVVQFMMQIKFNFSNFTFYGASAAAGSQRATGVRRRRWRL